MTLTIRPLKESDRAEWARLWRGYLDFYETTKPSDIYETTFARLIDPAETDMFSLIAEKTGEACGLVNCVIHRHLWRIEKVCYLGDLYVDPEIRGGGTGRALIEAVYAEADRRGAPYVYWLTQEINYRGRLLYDQVGEKTPFIKYQR